ncbi:MAG: hypothetical protein QF704_16230, partial [Anaerolineales bacterium]|nr:hypothetical protein [Anaerolineales bacterium]
DGRVGIGTASPDTPLHVEKNVAGGGTYITIENTDDTSSESEFSGIQAKLRGARNAGEIRFGKESSFSSDANADSNMKFYTAKDNTNTLALTIDENQKVGIGTMGPSAALEVSGDAKLATTTAGLWVKNKDADTVVLRPSNSNDAILITDDSEDRTRGIEIPNAGGLIVSSHASYTPLDVRRSGTTKFKMDSSDNAYFINGVNVGIGTTAPSALLHMAKSNAANQFYIDTYDDGSAQSQIRLRKSDSDTIGTISQTDDGDGFGNILFQGVDTGGGFDEGASIKAVQNGAASSRLPTNLIFETYSSTAKNENQLVLTSDGKVGIGTDSPSSDLDVQVQTDGNGS